MMAAVVAMGVLGLMGWWTCAVAQTYSVGLFAVQHRVTGTGSTYNRIVFDIQDENNQYVTTHIVSDFKITDPTGAVMVLPALTFYAYGLFKSCAYNGDTGLWGNWNSFDYTEFRCNTTDTLMAGTYTLEVTTLDGQVLTRDHNYSGPVAFPVVSAASFTYTMEASGGMIWGWDLPEEVYALGDTQESVTRSLIQVMKNKASLMLFSVQTPTHMGKAFFPKAIMDEVAASGGDEFNFSVSIRKPDSSDRASSSVVKLTSFPPQPTGDTDTIVLESDLSFVLPKVSYTPAGEAPMTLKAGFTFAGEQNGKLVWELDSVQ